MLNMHNKKNQTKFQALPRVAREPSEEAQLTKYKENFGGDKKKDYQGNQTLWEKHALRV